MADLQTQIEQAATSPASAASDGVSVTQRSLRELIDADRYLASKAAANRKGLGIKLCKLVPHGI